MSMKFTDDYGDLKVGDIIYIKGKCGKSWVKYTAHVKRFVNRKYIVPMYMKTIDSYYEPDREVIYPPKNYTYRWRKVENYDERI
jgi:hypothetical protein